MATKKSSNKKTITGLTDLQLRWLRGEDILHSENTMEALALLADAFGTNEGLWLAHGNPETHFWRPGLDKPITRDELRDHEASWLTPDNDLYGGESFFVWKFYNDDEKKRLWAEAGQKEIYKWEPVLRRPIPIGASVDAAMVAFTTIGPFNIA